MEIESPLRNHPIDKTEYGKHECVNYRLQFHGHHERRRQQKEGDVYVEQNNKHRCSGNNLNRMEYG